VFVVPPVGDAAQAPAPRWMRWFRGPLKRRLAREIRGKAGDAIEEAARVFANGLREWARKALARLAEQFAAQVEPLRASARSRVEDAATARADLRRLERSPGEGSAGKAACETASDPPSPG